LRANFCKICMFLLSKMHEKFEKHFKTINFLQLFCTFCCNFGVMQHSSMHIRTERSQLVIKSISHNIHHEKWLSGIVTIMKSCCHKTLSLRNAHHRKLQIHKCLPLAKEICDHCIGPILFYYISSFEISPSSKNAGVIRLKIEQEKISPSKLKEM